MKNTKLLSRICPVAIAVSFSMSVSAQHKLHELNGMQTRLAQSLRDRFTMHNGQLAPIPLSRSGAQKPTVVTARIVAMYQQEFDGAQYQGVDDSSRIYWSGTRGRNFDYAKFMMYSELSNVLDPMPLKSELDLIIPLYKTMNLDSLNTYTWDAGAMSFAEPHTRLSTTLTGSGLLNIATMRSLNGGVWENTNRSILTWNSDDNLTSTQSDNWDGALWEGSYKSVLSYDVMKNVTEVTSTQWDAGTSAWENDTRTSFSYTGGDLVTILDQDWSTLSSAWENDTRQTFGYDNGKWISTSYQDWNPLAIPAAWATDHRFTYTYDQNGKLTQQMRQEWNSLTSGWDNDERLTYGYDANGDLTSLTSHSWDGAAWEPDERYVYSYTASGGESTTSISNQDWDAGTSTWENKNRVNLKYNQYDRITEVVFQTWDAAGFWDVVTGDEKFNFIYETFEDGTNKVEEIVKTTGFRCYPNPASAYITVETDNSILEQVRLTDVTGRTVEHLTPAGNTQLVRIPTAQLVPGMYFLQVMYGGKMGTVSVQVQH